MVEETRLSCGTGQALNRHSPGCVRPISLGPWVKVLIEAGYLEGSDLFPALPQEEAAAKTAERKEVVAEAARQAGSIEPLKIVIDLMEQSVSAPITPRPIRTRRTEKETVKAGK